MVSRRGTPPLRRTREVHPSSCRHGFGNWGEIADFIGSNKTREDVEDHYQHIYLGGVDFLPVSYPSFSRSTSSVAGTRTASSSKITRRHQDVGRTSSPTRQCPTTPCTIVSLGLARQGLIDCEPDQQNWQQSCRNRRVHAQEGRLRSRIRQRRRTAAG